MKSKMEDDRLLSLKWNNHHSTFFHILANLREKPQYSDVTLACDGELFPTHKLVLSTCSDYFSSMLESTHCKAPVIVLKDVKKEHLSSLLRYMYLGEAEVRQNDLSGLIKVAESLRIKGLAVPDMPPDDAPTRVSSRKLMEDLSTVSPSRKRVRRNSNSSNSVFKNQSSKHVNNSNSDSKVRSSVAKNISTPIKTECFDISSPPRVEADEQYLLSQVKVEQDHAGVGASHSRLSDSLIESSDETSGGPTYKQDELDCSPLDMDQVAGPSRIEDDGLQEPWQQDGSDPSFTHDMFNTEDMTQQQMNVIGGSIPQDHFYDQQKLQADDTHLLPFLSNPNDSLFNPSTSLKSSPKSYKCSYCAYKTYLKGNLRQHERVHTGEKPFQCDYCPYSSTQKSALKVHQRTHTGERPYKCLLCNYSGSTPFTLQSHTAKIHPESPVMLSRKNWKMKPKI